LDADAVRHALCAYEPQEAPALPGRTNHLRAGILVPLRLGDDPTTILTERTSHLSNHAGEVCFPGGRPDADDPNLEATALREAEEELAIREARILGRLSSVPLYTSDFRLEPFVAEVGDTALRANPGEVKRVLEVPLASILSAPFLHGAPWVQDGQTILSPLFEVDGALVYGGTAYVLYELLTIVAPLTGRPVPPLRAGKYTWPDILASLR
jgi:8-oxo-dGTP pyrophosphatase MutT (NUDIX family)